jgi:hypothetical protein
MFDVDQCPWGARRQVIQMRIDTDRAIQLFGSEWVAIAILIATLAIGFYVVLK